MNTTESSTVTTADDQPVVKTEEQKEMDEDLQEVSSS